MADEKPVMNDAQKWHMALDLCVKAKGEKSWRERSKKIVERYRDDLDPSANTPRRFNILWSNVQTLTPAIYAHPPRPEVERRNKDQDAAGRCASIILERCLAYELEQFTDFHEAVYQCVIDRNLVGRGTAWVRYELEEYSTVLATDAPEAAAQDDTEDSLGGDEATPGIESITETEFRSRAYVDYVGWQDFRHSPARTWAEVTWVARRIYLSKGEGKKRFGDIFDDVPMSWRPEGLDEYENQHGTECGGEMLRGEVWEIWDKDTKEVIWVATGLDKLLDRKEDPYGLDEFFPCPKPLFATMTSDTLVPVPDYVFYQDQAHEIDMLTTKIGQLADALKVAGVYSKDSPQVADLLEAGNNQMIPCDNFAQYAASGGMKGMVDWFPIDSIVAGLNACLQAREQAKQVVYEITGISDIIRGATKASETATAQDIKRQFGSLRLSTRQRDVAQFCVELLRIKAQLMMDMYAAEQLAEMSGIENTPDAENINQGLALLRVEPLRSYRINISTDSMVEMDQEQEQASRMEFLAAAGGFLGQAMPLVEAQPELLPLAAQMLMFGIRGMKGGREMEATFQQAMTMLEDRANQPQEDPAQMAMQAQQQMEMQKMQQQAQIEQMRVQATMQTEQAKLQYQAQADQARMQADIQIKSAQSQLQAQLEMERARRQMEVDQVRAAMEQEIERVKATQNMQFQQWRAELDAAVKIQVAQMNSAAKGVLQVNPATEAATHEIATEVRQ